jgi:hypothetical protein
MDRRDFMRITGLASASIAIPSTLSSALAQTTADKPGPDKWRLFEVTTRVEVQKPVGVTRVWIPTPLAHDTPFQKTLGNTFQAEGGSSGYATDPKYGAGFIWAEWPEGVRPVLVTTSRFATRDIAVDFSKPGTAKPEDPAVLAKFTQATELIPTDGIVKATSDEIVKGKHGDLEKARAIRRRAAAARATSSFCSRTISMGANAPTSTRCSSPWRARKASPRATSMACAWRVPTSATRASGARAATSRTRSIAARSSTWRDTDGFPSTRPTFAR